MKHYAMPIVLAVIFAATAPDAHASPKAGYTWNQLADGLAYARLDRAVDSASSTRITTIHAIRIDPQRYRIDVITAAKDKPLGETVKAMAIRNNALIAVNGGFFTPDHQSIGLIVASGKKINRLHHTSWWSVFAIKNGMPMIIPPRMAKDLGGIEMAIQAGPRLVVNGVIPKLKHDGPHARTAIGITRDGKIILIATQGPGLAMDELAIIMKVNNFAGGLQCVDAMALDGGSSTQLYAKAGKLNLSISSFVSVPNGIAVFAR